MDDQRRIAPDDPRTPDVVALLERHLAFANRHSPPEDVHALDLDALAAPDISFYSCRLAREGAQGEDGELLGIGALRMLDPGHAELKSMHTVEAARGQGVGAAMVEHLLAAARQRGVTRVSLETGTPDAFAPARALYTRFGFEVCGPFGSYGPSPFSVCMTLALDH
jgi:putative acetyltransferase